MTDDSCLPEFFEEIILNLSKFIEIQNENSSFMIEMLNLCLFRCLTFCKTEKMLHFLLLYLLKYLKLPCYQRLLGLVNLSLLKICEKIRIEGGSMDFALFFEDCSSFLIAYTALKGNKHYNSYIKIYETCLKTLKMVLFTVVEANGLKSLEDIEKSEKKLQKPLDFQLKRWVTMIINPLNLGKTDRTTEIEGIIKMINTNEGDQDENILKLSDYILESQKNQSEVQLSHEYLNAALVRMLFIRKYPFSKPKINFF